MSAQFEAWGGGYEPPIIGGKHGFKLKDLKADIKRYEQRTGQKAHSWRGNRPQNHEHKEEK